MSKPMRRTYELRDGGNEYLRQTGRMSEREVQSWGYQRSGAMVREVAENTFRDRATLWHSDRRNVSDVWLGEPYDGCETCGLPRDEHTAGQQRFSVAISVTGETLEHSNARVACENFV